MKRIFALMLALLMLLTTFVACSKEDGEDEGEGVDLTVSNTELVYQPEGDYGDAFYYEYINGDEVSIIGYSGSHVPHAITVPANITIGEKDFPVTDIATDAFKAKTNLTAVTLPDSVVAIGDMAFYGCISLATVKMPASLTTIGTAAFAKCEALDGIVIPEAVTEIGEMAFYGCKTLSEIALPEAVTVLPAQIFMNCENLWTVSWSEKGTKICESAFMGCTLLKTFNFPETLEEIENFAFATCAKLNTATIGEKVTKIGLNAFYDAALMNVTFVNQTGWRTYELLENQNFENMTVTSTAENAKNLSKDYCNFYWVLVTE